ncbi:hypothetical protein HanLR1_Chr12g0428571 [Helianthus annuus]|nr:hypothetical protein HanLR1_Chr12g0428571 [Helianthus annuus]
MKGGGGGGGGYLYNKHGLKMKQLSLFFIIFVCASLVLWNWDKTPHLTALLPPMISHFISFQLKLKGNKTLE